ncbi:CobW family GTP-binding protein [Syntrophomonas wolfei]|jgi:G3E family GTPase|uniref:CobW family GTP-binding protein n=1 Tax=Syntrophomonas wolfei TaxID=863 RepID=UPI0023F0458E|nr:GTP-binding protein [Syntrophomonas wolfei]
MTRVHIISGFLGAGKTTLLLNLLAFVEGNKVIIENEFGEVGIDGEVLQRENYDVVEMAQGCICCSMKANFEAMLLSVLEDYHPEHIFIEPTGIGMLSEITALFKRKDITDKYSLTMPLVVVDALEYLVLVEEFGLFYKNQIAHAGIIVLSKVQLMREDNLDVIIKSLRTINPRADIMARDWGQFSELDYWELTNTVFDPEKNITVGVATGILSGDLQSYSLTAPKRINREDLQNILDNLQNQQLGRIVRAKGFVEGDDGSLEFSYINGGYTINENCLGNSSRVCIIGSNLNRDRLAGIWFGDGEVAL